MLATDAIREIREAMDPFVDALAIEEPDVFACVLYACVPSDGVRGLATLTMATEYACTEAIRRGKTHPDYVRAIFRKTVRGEDTSPNRAAEREVAPTCREKLGLSSDPFIAFEQIQMDEARREILAMGAPRQRRVEAIRRYEHRHCRMPCTTIPGVCPARYEPHMERPAWAYAHADSPEEHTTRRQKQVADLKATLAKLPPPPPFIPLPMVSEPEPRMPPLHEWADAETIEEPPDGLFDDNYIPDADETSAAVVFGNIRDEMEEG